MNIIQIDLDNQEQVRDFLEQGWARIRHIAGHDGNEQMRGNAKGVVETIKGASPGIKVWMD